MSKANPTTYDIERSSRLLEERNKNFNSRKEFSTLTKIPAGTLEGWEKRNVNISCEGLKELDKNGFDIYYIITGKRKSAGNDSQNALLEAKDEIIAGLKRENELLRKQLEGTSENRELVKIAEKLNELYHERRSNQAVDEEVG